MNLKLAAAIAVSTALCAAPATAEDSPVGTYIIEQVTETVNGFSCQAIRDAGTEIDCESTRLIQIRADGTVAGRNRWAPTQFLTDSFGTWRQRPNGKVVSEGVLQLFDENGVEAGFLVGESTYDFSAGYKTFTGTSTSRSYLDGQDITDEFATPNGVREATFTGRRVLKR